MMIQEVSFGSPLYELTKKFREEILRRPLGLMLGPEDLLDEDRQVHIAAVDSNGCLLGTVVLKPLSPNAVKLRQMAVAQECRGKGIGRELLLWAECTAFARGLLDIELHARVSARGFYEKVGYQDAGAVFIELGSVPTIKMLKCIQTEPS